MSIQPPDLPGGRAARDAGIDLVMAKNLEWKKRAHQIAADLRGWRGIGEDLRMLIVDRIGPPTKPQAWGGLVQGIYKKGLLVKTGERRQMRQKKSHARDSAVYRSLR